MKCNREERESEEEDPNSRGRSETYCFAAAAILPSGFMPLFAISSPRLRIGIPSIYSITKALLIKPKKKRKAKNNERSVK